AREEGGGRKGRGGGKGAGGGEKEAPARAGGPPPRERGTARTEAPRRRPPRRRLPARAGAQGAATGLQGASGPGWADRALRQAEGLPDDRGEAWRRRDLRCARIGHHRRHHPRVRSGSRHDERQEVRVMGRAGFTLGQLAAALKATVDGDAMRVVTGVASLEAAGPEHIAFVADGGHRRAALTSRAGAFLAADD